jgi:Neutral/alkaline non-lysosomal ceramidase, N-terminal
LNHLLAGVGRCDITPAPGTPQGGWGAQVHQRGLGADMPLYATALVLSDTRETVAIIDVDAIGFDREWTDKIIDAAMDLSHLPREHIRFSCTHTHSGPNTFRLSTITEGLDMVKSYLDELPRRVAGAVWQAQQSLKPVRCAAGRGSCEINVNRRLTLPDGQVVVGKNWDGPVDHTVRIVRFDDLNQNPVATLLHYACHPTIMAWQCEYATPDYPGVARQVVEQQLGGVCLFLQGATGNVGPREGFTGDVKVYRRLGTLLGLEGAKVALSTDTMRRRERLAGVLQSGAPLAIYEQDEAEAPRTVLRMLSRQLQLPLARFRPVEELEIEATECSRQYEHVVKSGTEQEVRAARARLTQANMRLENARSYQGKTHMDWQLQGIRIGSVALLSIPGEPFTEINQQIVSESPFADTLFSGYSNGGFGYLPIRSAFVEGGYEVQISPFSADAADIVVKEGLKMLKELAEETNSS